MSVMTPAQLDAAAMIQTIAESMTQATEHAEGERRRWNPSYVRRQGRKLLECLEQLIPDDPPDDLSPYAAATVDSASQFLLDELERLDATLHSKKDIETA
jgi:hypothetical protein